MAVTANADIPAIDADGHIMERVADVRRYLSDPWKNRKTPMWPGDQPWDAQLFETIGYPALPERPSDVFRKSTIKMSIEADETFFVDTLNFAGPEHFVFASDIPHWDSEWPHNIQGVRRHPKLSVEIKRKLLYGNAKEFYSL